LESFTAEIFEDAVLVTINRRQQTTSLSDVMTANQIKRMEWSHVNVGNTQVRRQVPAPKKKGKAKRKGKAGKKA
jgi:hypothetical protein